MHHVKLGIRLTEDNVGEINCPSVTFNNSAIIFHSKLPYPFLSTYPFLHYLPYHSQHCNTLPKHIYSVLSYSMPYPRPHNSIPYPRGGSRPSARGGQIS